MHLKNTRKCISGYPNPPLVAYLVSNRVFLYAISEEDCTHLSTSIYCSRYDLVFDVMRWCI